MQPFRDILVGVDLTQYDVTTLQPSDVAREVVRRALCLAGKSSGRLTFLAALNLTSEALPHVSEADFQSLTSTAEKNAAKILHGLVQEARNQGIEATDKIARGGAWLELVREVLREKNDLVVIGTRDRHGLGRMIFGSTAVKVVRRCPCPVWVVKPGPERERLNILVPSDMAPVTDEGLRLAFYLAGLTPATVHLLHVVDFPLDHIWSITRLPDARDQAYRRAVRRKAEEDLRAQFQRVTAGDPSAVAGVHLLDDPGGLPDEAILGFIRAHAIDLVIMGTVGRSGISGALIGNTAERMLPELSCSLLALKPTSFVTPVRL